MFIDKVRNFLKNNDKKNKELWFAKEELIDYASTPKTFSDNASDKTVTNVSSRAPSSFATSRELDTTRNKDDILMIEHSKISVNYVRHPTYDNI